MLQELIPVRDDMGGSMHRPLTLAKMLKLRVESH